jgi:RNA polymerase sigma-70 factor (ECF subfamily)
MAAQPSDRSLIRRLREGDNRAAAELHDRYSRRMRGLARRRLDPALSARVDVEDIVQSALASFFRAASKGLYQAPASGELWQLLSAITRHKLNHARSRHLAAKRDARRTVAATDAIRASTNLAEQLASELKLSIDELVQEYSAVERQIVQLRIEGHEVEQIADRVARSRRTVERVLHGFRNDLRRIV